MESPSPPSSPFDFEDEDEEGAPRGRGLPRNRFLRWCVIFSLASFLVSLIGSIVENNAVGNPGLESTAIAANRSGMLGVLLGCIGIFAAFRAPAVLASRSASMHQRTKWSVWWLLLIWSVLGYVSLAIGLYVVAMLTRGAGLFYSLFPMSLVVSWILVIAIWHGGVVRAYSVGFLSSLVLHLPLIWNFSSASSGYSPYRMYSNFRTDLAFQLYVWMMVVILMAVTSGLLCSGYVSLLERSRRLRALALAKSPESDNVLQPPSS